MKPSMEQITFDFSRPPFSATETTAEQVARYFDRISTALEAARVSRRRVSFYRTAAERIRRHGDELMDRLAEVDPRQIEGSLESVAGIDPQVASLLGELWRTGRIDMLERAEAQVTPRDRLTLIDGIGPTMADRVVGELGVTDLTQLEEAVHDGRLERVHGFGPHRMDQVRLCLEARRRRAESVPRVHRPPSFPLLLGVDQMFRDRRAPSAHDRDIWRVERQGWSFSANFDPDLPDLVIVHANRDGHYYRFEVETERRGSLAGCRLVRGHEGACRRLHLDARVAA